MSQTVDNDDYEKYKSTQNSQKDNLKKHRSTATMSMSVQTDPRITEKTQQSAYNDFLEQSSGKQFRNQASSKQDIDINQLRFVITER